MTWWYHNTIFIWLLARNEDEDLYEETHPATDVAYCYMIALNLAVDAMKGLRIQLRKTVCTLILLALSAFCVPNTQAQTMFLTPLPAKKPVYSLRYLHASLSSDQSPSMFSGLYEFTVSFPTSERLNFVFSLPFSSVDFGDASSDFDFGNLYVGIQRRVDSNENHFTAGSLGMFLPVASKRINAGQVYGCICNPRELQKTLGGYWSFYGNFTSRHRFSGNLSPEIGLEVGPLFMLNREPGADQEFFLHYGLSASLRTSRFAFLTEFTGLFRASGEWVKSSEKFENFIAFGVAAINGTFRPHLFYQIPLDEPWESEVDGMLGIKLEYAP